MTKFRPERFRRVGKWRVHRLWHARMYRHGINIRCSVEVPSWIRIRHMGVMNKGSLDWDNNLVFSWRPKWWCWWRWWDEGTPRRSAYDG